MHQDRGNAVCDPRDCVRFGSSLMRYDRLRQGGDGRSHPIRWIVHLDCSIAELPDAYPPPISHASFDLASTEPGGQRLISADNTTLLNADSTHKKIGIHPFSMRVRCDKKSAAHSAGSHRRMRGCQPWVRGAYEGGLRPGLARGCRSSGGGVGTAPASPAAGCVLASG